MTDLGGRLEKQFSGKVYPNPSDPEVRVAMEKGRAELEKSYLGKKYPWILGGQTFVPVDQKTYATVNPANRSMVVGKFPDVSCLSKAEVANLLAKTRRAAINFSQTVHWRKRFALLQEISKVVEERFWILVAAKQYETGQSIMEAIGETDEEVDFPLAVALYLEELNCDLLWPSPKFAGDFNGKRYVPHGVFLNICPFNFPGAIPMDMACKALAMGNAIIEKSSNKSSLCGYLVYESIVMAFERLGISHEGVVNYVPGGPEIVDMLLASSDIAGVSFTGSSAALWQIKEKHGQMLRNGYHGRAPLVFGSAETSGVNIAVVWNDADVKYAAQECLKSFIGRQGQKCSSVRVILAHTDIVGKFSDTLESLVDGLQVGDCMQGCDVGPVITPEAGEKIESTFEDLLFDGVIISAYSHPIPITASVVPRELIFPTILYTEALLEDARKAQVLMNTEMFGPITTIVPVSSLEDVRKLCALSDFALTGTSFTSDIDVAVALSEIIPAGNLYHNRKCTGALVETECFGGLRSKSSPTGIKGKYALALFGSMQVTSGFYDPSWDEGKTGEFIRRMDGLGFGFSKTNLRSRLKDAY